MPDQVTFEYPAEPFDAIRWFMPAFREYVTNFFDIVNAKIHQAAARIPDTEEQPPQIEVDATNVVEQQAPPEETKSTQYNTELGALVAEYE